MGISFRDFSQNKTRRSGIRGKTSVARILGTRTQRGAMEAMIVEFQWKMLHFVVKTLRQKDFSMFSTFGNVSFLVLCHFWTNLSSGVTASPWNVDHVFRGTTTLLCFASQYMYVCMFAVQDRETH